MRARLLAAGPYWLAVLGIGLLVRLALAIGTEVYFDETYYWTWSRALAWSYFDHPPMIAWAIAAMGIRGTALLSGLGAMGLVFLLARETYGENAAAVRAAALFGVAPAAVLAGFIATPDSTLLLFWAATLWALKRERWALAGVLAGLAFLSKYNAVLLGPVVLLACVWERRFPRGVWWTLLLAILVGSPVVLWNAANDWVGFEFQLRHGLGGRGGLASFGEFLGGQLAMAGPVVFVLALFWIFRGPREQRLLRIATAVPLVFFGVAALRTRGEANWAGMAYVAACVGVAGMSARWTRIAAAASALVCVLGASHLLFPVVEPKRDVALQRLHGWEVLASLSEESPAAIFAPSYQLASEAAYHARVPTDVVGGYRKSQYDVWPELELAPGAEALWLSEGPAPPEELTRRFARIQGPRILEGTFRGRVLHRFSVWRLGDFGGQR